MLLLIRAKLSYIWSHFSGSDNCQHISVHNINILLNDTYAQNLHTMHIFLPRSLTCVKLALHMLQICVKLFCVARSDFYGDYNVTAGALMATRRDINFCLHKQYQMFCTNCVMNRLLVELTAKFCFSISETFRAQMLILPAQSNTNYDYYYCYYSLFIYSNLKHRGCQFYAGVN